MDAPMLITRRTTTAAADSKKQKRIYNDLDALVTTASRRPGTGSSTASTQSSGVGLTPPPRSRPRLPSTAKTAATSTATVTTQPLETRRRSQVVPSPADYAHILYPALTPANMAYDDDDFRQPRRGKASKLDRLLGPGHGWSADTTRRASKLDRVLGTDRPNAVQRNNKLDSILGPGYDARALTTDDIPSPQASPNGNGYRDSFIDLDGGSSQSYSPRPSRQHHLSLSQRALDLDNTSITRAARPESQDSAYSFYNPPPSARSTDSEFPTFARPRPESMQDLNPATRNMSSARAGLLDALAKPLPVLSESPITAAPTRSAHQPASPSLALTYAFAHATLPEHRPPPLRPQIETKKSGDSAGSGGRRSNDSGHGRRSGESTRSNTSEQPGEQLPLPPTTNTLTRRDRADLIRKNRKLAKVLGETPGSFPAPAPGPVHHRGWSEDHASSPPHHVTAFPQYALGRAASIASSGSAGRRHSTPLSPTDVASLYARDPPPLTIRDTARIRTEAEEGASSPTSFIDLSEDDDEAANPSVTPTAAGGGQRNALTPAAGEDVPRRGRTASMLTAQTANTVSTEVTTTSTGTELLDSEAEERRKKRARLAKLHRFLGSQVPTELVLGPLPGGLESGLPPTAEAPSPNGGSSRAATLWRGRSKERKGRKRRSSSAGACDPRTPRGWVYLQPDEFETRMKDDLSENEKMVNVKRALKMGKMFGEQPPQSLYHTRASSAVPMARGSTPLPSLFPPGPSLHAGPIIHLPPRASSFSHTLHANLGALAPSPPRSSASAAPVRGPEPYGGVGGTPSSSVSGHAVGLPPRFGHSYHLSDAGRPSTSTTASSRPSTGQSTTGLIASYQRDSTRTEREPGPRPLTPAAAYAQEERERLFRQTALPSGGSPYIHYRNSLNSLNRIIDTDDRASLAELYNYVHGHDDSDSDLPRDTPSPSPSRGSRRGRRRSLPGTSTPSVVSFSTVDVEDKDPAGFQTRRRRAAKLTQFFGVDYRSLFSEVLESIEMGMREEVDRGSLTQDEIQELTKRLTNLKIRREQIQP